MRYSFTVSEGFSCTYTLSWLSFETAKQKKNNENIQKQNIKTICDCFGDNVRLKFMLSQRDIKLNTQWALVCIEMAAFP